MSNYVANYVFCNEELYNDFLNVDFDHRLFQEGMYDPIGCALDSERYLVIFDTRGMEYKTESIQKIFSRYHDVIWNCVEENHVEEGHFYWDGEKASCSVRGLQEASDDCFFDIEYMDPDFKVFKIIMGFPNRIVEENFVTNTRKSFYLSEYASNQIMGYMDSIKSRILQDTDYGEYSSYTDGDIREECWFWGNEKHSDRAGICKIDFDQLEQIDTEEIKKGDRLINEVKEYLRDFFQRFRIDIQLFYKEIGEFAVSDNKGSRRVKDLELIHEFAVEYRDKLMDPGSNERDIENGFAERCMEFGFNMDCGNQFIEKFTEDAFLHYESFESIQDEIEDADFLGSVIFSYWRKATHWSNSNLLDDDNRKWLIIALDLLAVLTDPYCDKPFAFDGKLSRIHLYSNNICYGPCPQPDDEVIQELYIICDGIVWVKRYSFGDGYPYIIKNEERYDVPIASIERVFTAVLDYFNSDWPDEFATDVGSWEIFLEDKMGKSYRVVGSMHTDLYSSFGGLSDIIRTEFGIPDLFVFDGNYADEDASGEQ